ncbi:Sodium/calcium exchanger protein-domain-containing protein [Cyathus striatus]|nr:Sodium/calcium exchanger protein-domain-containing protein [Cyathus striatus]
MEPQHSSTNTPESPVMDATPSSRATLPYFWRSRSTKFTDRCSIANLFKGWKVVLLGSWFNILIILLPISRMLKPGMVEPHAMVFACCILALIPLVRLHDLSTRDLAIRIGGSKTGLLNASMSNVVEIVVAISALNKCELRVVQSSLVGGILSKLLLVLGMCFFAGGLRFSEQGFDATATQLHSSLLTISVGALLLPVAYHFTFGSTKNREVEIQNILHMSHGVSIVLLFIYIAYLAFQLWSHTHLYNDDHNKTSRRLSVTAKIPKDTAAFFRSGKQRVRDSFSFQNSSELELSRMETNGSTTSLTPLRRPYLSPLAMSASSSEITLCSSPTLSPKSEKKHSLYGNGYSRNSVSEFNLSSPESPSRPATFSRFSTPSVVVLEKIGEEAETVPEPVSDETSRKEPQLSWFLTIALLICVAATVAVTADWLVESMDGISDSISKEWVGLILLPAITSVAECITAVRVSVKDELSLSISVAVGSTIQTALFVIPFLEILAWATHKPLSLLLDPFQSLVLYISVQTVGYVVADGKSNWLEGMILICLYVIVGVSFWFYPGSHLPDSLGTCVA